VTYEIFKTLNLDTFKDRHIKVCDCAIIKFLSLHFQLQWKHKCKAINTNAQWKSLERISMYNRNKPIGYLKPKRCLVKPFIKIGIWHKKNDELPLRTRDWFHYLANKPYVCCLFVKTQSIVTFQSSFMDQDSCYNERILVGEIQHQVWGHKHETFYGMCHVFFLNIFHYLIT